MIDTSAPTTEQAPPATGVELHETARDEWVELAEGFLDHNYRHCWDYAALMAARAGAAVENMVVRRDGAPLGLASVRVKQLPGLRAGIAYVSGGPLVRRR